MQAKTLGTWGSFLTSVGAGALTQSPDYQWLALPVAVVSGSFFLVLVGMYLFSNRRELYRLAKLIEPSHVIVLGLVIAFCGTIWQWRRPDPKNALLQQQIAALQSGTITSTSPTDHSEFERERAAREKTDKEIAALKAISEIDRASPEIEQKVGRRQTFQRKLQSDFPNTGPGWKIYWENLLTFNQQTSGVFDEARELLKRIGYPELATSIDDVSEVDRTGFDSVMKEGESFKSNADKHEYRKEMQRLANIHAALAAARSDAESKLGSKLLPEYADKLLKR